MFSFVVLLLPALFVGGLLALAGNISDGFRLGCLALLNCSFYWFSIKKDSRFLLNLAHVFLAITSLDSLVRALVWHFLQSDIDAYFIVQSLANSSLDEAWEFMLHHILTLVFIIGFIGFWITTYHFLVTRLQKENLTSLWRGKTRLATILCALLLISAFTIKPTYVQFTPIFWTRLHQKVELFKKEIIEHQKIHQNWDENAKTANLSTSYKQQTVVLILSESVTSFNWNLCGYPRQTNPELAKHSEIQVFCNAYSPFAFTIGALKADLTDSSRTNPDSMKESVLAVARSAGYKIWWLSNQDDSYISSLFGSYADHAVYLNKRSGRSTHSLDEKLFPAFDEALNDKAPLKLIVLHLLGAHPNYSSRYTPSFERFSDNNDEVMKQMKERYLFIQSARNKYDNALLYQDWFMTQLLEKLQKQSPPRAFLFVSDHGNEVGHEMNYAGHNPSTEAGYRVPAVIWRDDLNGGIDRDKLLDTSDVDATLLDLMGIQQSQHSWLHKDYRFTPHKDWKYWEKK